MILVGQMGEKASQTAKALALASAGVANQQIAKLLGTTTASVNQQLYVSRQGKGRKKGGAGQRKKKRR